MKTTAKLSFMMFVEWFIKALVMVLSVMGYFSMSQAITAEVGVMFMALLNSAWISKYTV